jgi:hypothetical protein
MKRMPKKQPKTEISELDVQVSKAHPLLKQAFSEYKKEISNLQKQLIKEQIRHQAEIERMKAEYEQKIKSLPDIVLHVIPPNKNKDTE